METPSPFWLLSAPSPATRDALRNCYQCGLQAFVAGHGNRIWVSSIAEERRISLMNTCANPRLKPKHSDQERRRAIFGGGVSRLLADAQRPLRRIVR